ncbi:MAG: 50S ribosomal protein L2 [Bacteroidales bacterium]|nr:50S ribosomal protein L2 [Bacteroidales bacterium]
MAVKKIKPTTPGQRGKIAPVFDNITKTSPEKSLTTSKTRSGGRNSDGRMTTRNIGGGHKKKYRLIDFKRNKDGIPAIVNAIEYDPNRSARIALLFYKDGEKRYILAPRGIEVGQEVMSGKGVSPEIGNTLFLSDIPLGTIVHNVELYPGKGGIMARSAGTYVQLVAREGKYAIVKLPSGETRKILVTCKATIGYVSNSDHKNVKHGKAGRRRWLGRRPRVRGVAMNPVDHPMGGGEGRSSGGHPRSRNGLYAKGMPTRSPKKISNKFILERARSRKRKK